MFEPWRSLLTLVVGLVTGLLSAMFGVGGTIVSTPAIRLLGASPLLAVGTTLPAILPSAVAGSVRYTRARLVDWAVVRRVAPVGVASAVVGARLSHAVPGRGHLLMVATAGLIMFTAVRLAGRPRAPRAATQRLRGWRPALVGILAGGSSGLLGVGGGVLMVPAFTDWLGLPIKQTVATSLACVGIFALPSTVAHAMLGDIDWSFAIPLSVAVVPGAMLGSRLAVRASDRHLRLAVAATLGAVALIYGGAELAAWG